MFKKLFAYFFILAIIIEVLFYLSDGLEREQERRGFIKCWSGSHVVGRPEWRADCADPTLSESIKHFLNRN